MKSTIQYKRFSGTIELWSNPAVYTSIKPMPNAEFAKRFPGTKGVRYDGCSMEVGYAPGATKNGQELPVTRRIAYKINGTKHKCGPRCRNAKGGDCECSCGGQFHGIGEATKNPPYPFCHHPEICTPKGTCQRDPNCCD